MAGMDKMVKKGFIRYTKKKYPNEAERIIRKADKLFPKLYAKAPDIGGKENAMAYNLDMMLIAISFFEASDHRIDGSAFGEIAEDIFSKLRFLGKFINVNHKWQMKLLKKMMYKRYIPYSRLVDEKIAKGEWGNTWKIKINPRHTNEGVCFDLVGCPLADYAKANGYMNILPFMCATDHILPEIIHAKLIRTHTCALGSDSCDYWYVADKSKTAKKFKGKII